MTPAQISADADRIAASVQLPVIPDKVFPLDELSPDFAVAINPIERRHVVQNALDEVAGRGGGRLMIPADRSTEGPTVHRLRGPLHLGSRVALLLDRDVVLHFEFDPAAYLIDGQGVLTRYEGTTVYSFSPLIRACGATDVAVLGIEGDGQMPVIRGDGAAWVKWAFDGQNRQAAEGREPTYVELKRVNDEQVPLAGRQYIDPDDSYLRPTMLSFLGCQRVLVEGVKLVESPFWTVHPTLSSDLTFRGIRFHARVANNDGIDPDACRNVLIENVDFDNADDNVAIKSGRGPEGREGLDVRGTELESINHPLRSGDALRSASERIVVRNCRLKGHHALCIGSEASGDVRDVYMVDNHAVDPVKFGLFIKSSRYRGGVTERVYVKGLKIAECIRGAICINTNYDNAPDGRFPPVVRDVSVTDVHVGKSPQGLTLQGWPDAPVERIAIRRVMIDRCETPEPAMTNVREVTLEEVRIGGSRFEGRFDAQNESWSIPAVV